MVQNLVPLNKRTRVLHYPSADVPRTRASLGRSPFISKIDLKAGYFNVPLSPRSARLTTFHAPGGRCYWKRMTQGLQNAPAHFQRTMEQVLEGLPVCILLDDVTCCANDVAQCVQDTVDAIVRLATAGAMIGLYKGIIAAEEVEFMGDWWSSGGFFRPMVDKVTALLELSEEALSSMHRPQLYGMLSYWRLYLPDFASRTARLRGLLGSDARSWTPAHTEEVRSALRVIAEGAPAINFNPTAPAILEVHAGPQALSGVLLQEDTAGKRWLPVATWSRALAGMEG